VKLNVLKKMRLWRKKLFKTEIRRGAMGRGREFEQDSNYVA
jgi:hypothetical protein